MKPSSRTSKAMLLGVSAAALMAFTATAHAASKTYTLTADFDSGAYSNTNGAGDQLQLNANIVTQFDFIWVALSGRDSVVRIDTDFQDSDDGVIGNNNHGAVLGEYYSRPGTAGNPTMAGNPSRTTVDLNGDVWVANRNEASGGQGSITKIGLNPSGPGTSTGVFNAGTGDANTFDRRPWTNAGGADSLGGTSTASDPAILQYVRTAGTNVRTMAIDANNNLWTGGLGNRQHQLYDGATGAAIPGTNPPFTSFNNGNGGYGGLVDGNGIVWSASSPGCTNCLVRFDPTTGVAQNINTGGRVTYGLAVDTNGKIWMSNWSQNSVQRYSATGVLEGTFSSTGSNLRGVAVTPGDNDVWVAGSGNSRVVRYNNDGTIQATIGVGNTPTGVAVDSNGKVWVTNFGSNNVMRINPATNLIDLTIDLGPNATPYNYSDMTGSVSGGVTNPMGNWSDVFDSGIASTMWDQILWNTEPEGLIPMGSSIVVEARAASTMAGLMSESFMTYGSGDLLGLTGQYLEVKATLSRPGALNAPSPILSDLQVSYTQASEPATMGLVAGAAVLGGLAMRRRQRQV